jgi:hypothetical protein
MKNLIRLLFALLVLLTPSLGYAQVHQGVPPQELWGFNKFTGVFEFSNGVQGRLEFHGNLKYVRTSWRYAGADPKEQVFATSYHPTGVIALAATKWLVAGKTTRGATVLELWTVQKPLVITSIPGGDPVIGTATVTAIDEIYDEATVGRDMIELMCRKAEDTNKVLLQFYDSKALYEINLTTQAYALVANPTASGSALVVPALNHKYRQFWTREHTTQGYVYVLASTGTSLESLVFKDTNKDGTIDAFQVVNNATWASTYAASSNYVQ